MNLNSLNKQRGIALVDLMLAVVAIGVISAVGYGIYNTIGKDTALTDMKQKTVAMVGKVREAHGNSGDFSALSGTSINALGAKPDTWRLSGTDLLDNMGNVVDVNGSATAFALRFPSLTKETCASLAAGLQGLAHQVNVGSASAVSIAAGVITGGSAYKAAGGTPSPTNLATGCGATEPLAVALVFR